MPKCTELLPCDWLISNFFYQAVENVYLIKWPVIACVCVCIYIYIYIYIYIICIKKMMTFLGLSRFSTLFTLFLYSYKNYIILFILFLVNTLHTVLITIVEIIYNAKLQYYIHLKVIFT